MTSYYDLDDIISESHRIPCNFNTTVKGLGVLEGNPGKDITENTKLELPLWISTILAQTEIEEGSGITFIQLLQPDAVGKNVINTIKTSSVSLDVHSISTHYYSLIGKWAELFNDKELVDTIATMLKERCLEINAYAQNLSGQQQESGFLYSLDEFEKQVYRGTHASYKSARNWIYGP